MILNIITQNKKSMPTAFIRAWLLAVEKELDKKLKKKSLRDKLKRELSIVFLPKTQARRLNFQYRGRDYATDVLSFEAESAEEGLGELVICSDLLQAQADEHGVTQDEELGYLLLHGVLHLLGYDHEASPSRARVMFRLQDEIFDSLREKIHVGRRGKKHVHRRRNIRAQA